MFFFLSSICCVFKEHLKQYVMIAIVMQLMVAIVNLFQSGLYLCGLLQHSYCFIGRFVWIKVAEAFLFSIVLKTLS